ncbi:MAG: hypothetical protein M3619_04525 [Myxococcota bacterium]|nr:hypothetical protein [Myxococcota bacterium]
MSVRELRYLGPIERDADENIPGLLPINAPMDPAWELKERARRAESDANSFYNPAPGEVDSKLELAWFYEWERRNDHARERHADRKACRRMIAADNPRHAAAIESSDFDKLAPAVVAIEKWSKDPKHPIAVLAGPPGTGKTSAAVLWQMLHADGDSKRIPKWIIAAEFARSSRYDDDRDKVLDAHALVLDDLGAEYADVKGSFRTDLDELVDRYYSDNRRLLITSNLDWKTFEERYGARVTDRLAEAGVWIPVTGASRRRKPTL